MCAEKSLFHRQGRRLAQQLGGAQHFELGARVQPIARFYFHRSHPLIHQPPQPARRAADKLCVRGVPRCLYGGNNTAAGTGDVRITRALQSQFELARTIAGKHQVGMTIDQARGEHGAAQVVHLARQSRRFPRQSVTRAEPDDKPRLHTNRSALDAVIAPIAHRYDPGIKP